MHLNKYYTGNMETLVLALIIVRNQHRQTEKSLPEPNDFQPFDLQALLKTEQSFQFCKGIDHAIRLQLHQKLTGK
jgi:hypothetical protein